MQKVPNPSDNANAPGGAAPFIGPPEYAAWAARLEARVARLEADARTEQLPPPLLSVADVARVLSVSVRTVEKLISAGHLRPLRVIGQRRIPLEAVEAYKRTCAVPPRRRRSKPAGSATGKPGAKRKGEGRADA